MDFNIISKFTGTSHCSYLENTIELKNLIHIFTSVINPSHWLIFEALIRTISIIFN